jgi:uncharacterized membrane protein
MIDDGSLNTSLKRNIEALRRRRREEEANAGFEDRLASVITRFTGSMGFVYAHLALYGFWIVANLGWLPGLGPSDPTFVILAMIASVEAIFLATFVLITQNRMAAAADRRAELDVQISLLAEAEITKLGGAGLRDCAADGSACRGAIGAGGNEAAGRPGSGAGRHRERRRGSAGGQLAAIVRR